MDAKSSGCALPDSTSLAQLAQSTHDFASSDGIAAILLHPSLI
jgi:hypothetical protein